MKITPRSVSIRELTENYKDSGEFGVVGLNNLLDIRPPYQREFVYNDKQRNAVLETVRKGFPLSLFYWVDKGDGSFEVLDGQQRTLSICQYVNGDFSLDDKGGTTNYFNNLTPTEQEQILDYEISVYVCEGGDRERLEWFETINVAGEVLTPQELLNAHYTGPWLSDARLKFSKRNCVAAQLSAEKGELMRGQPIRQEYLETVLKWINRGDVAGYMAKHQHDASADDLLDYFKHVVHWARKTFPTYYRQMAGLPWGEYYNEYRHGTFDVDVMDVRIKELMADDEVTRKPGIFAYMLTGQERHLNLRTFSNAMKATQYHIQGGKCPVCEETFTLAEMDADHIVPWSKGGKTDLDNCQMLCRPCNRSKGAK